ncbi:LysR family transcriptional regulator [Novosphingobium sp. ZN18A2]|uniref:LysR family transcriptional regulator n=1 Tax=Novosphingobium sp. ZN18A2 TaxID=3079861 RepID=UPI0030D4840F
MTALEQRAIAIALDPARIFRTAAGDVMRAIGSSPLVLNCGPNRLETPCGATNPEVMTGRNLQVMSRSRMPTLPFTLRQLDVFGTLCKTMSFRKCADELGVSQASISNQIKVLENQLGFRLFARPAGLPPSLTREGLAFLSDLGAFQDAAARLAAHRRKTIDERQVRSFRILIANGIMERYIKPKLDRFIAKNQFVECDFVTQHPRALPIRSIAGGQYDFALYHAQEMAAVPEGQTVLAHLETGIIGHNRLVAGRPLPLSADELSDLPMVLPPKSSELRQRVLSALARKGVIPRNVVGNTQYHEVMAQMIERGVGVGPLPIAMINREARANVSQIFPVTKWTLLWYRKPGLDGDEADAVERFMKSSVLADPDYASSATIAPELPARS